MLQTLIRRILSQQASPLDKVMCPLSSSCMTWHHSWPNRLTGVSGMRAGLI